MKRYVDAGPLTCRNCGQPLTDDSRSSTGLVHETTKRSRCDGQLNRQAPWAGRLRKAVAA